MLYAYVSTYYNIYVTCYAMLCVVNHGYMFSIFWICFVPVLDPVILSTHALKSIHECSGEAERTGMALISTSKLPHFVHSEWSIIQNST